MVVVTGDEKLFSVSAQMRFGLPRQFGRCMIGFTHFGLDDNFFNPVPYGKAGYGSDKYADIILFSGIYRRHTMGDSAKTLREPYYIPRNPRKIDQQAQRNKMTNAVLAWQALTTVQKSIYNKKAIGKHLYGYNVFLSEYLLSH